MSAVELGITRMARTKVLGFAVEMAELSFLSLPASREKPLSALEANFPNIPDMRLGKVPFVVLEMPFPSFRTSMPDFCFSLHSRHSFAVRLSLGMERQVIEGRDTVKVS